MGRDKTHNSGPNNKNCRVQARQEHFPWTRRIPATIQPQPKHAAQAVSEPAREECTDQTQEIVEDGYRFCYDPRDDPQYQYNQRPPTEAAPASLRHAVSPTEQPDVYVLGGDMAVDNTRDDDGRDGDAVGDFAKEGRGRAKGGRRDVYAGVAVGNDCYDEVHRGVHALKEEQRFGVLGGGVKFGDEGEKGDMAWCFALELFL